MRKFTFVGALLAVLALGVVAVSAFGADNTVWLCKEKPIIGASERCLVDSENEGVLHLEDMKADSAVECASGSVLDEGWVGPGSEDETTTVEFMNPTVNCKPSPKALNAKEEEVTNVCEAVTAVEAQNLAWSTLLELVGGEKEDQIKPGPSKNQPGYLVTCKTALGTIDDTCNTVAGKEADVKVVNLPGTATEPPLVTVEFSATILSELTAKCGVGGAESGLVVGNILFAALVGGVLASLEVSAP
jgi:hypothetical protein